MKKVFAILLIATLCIMNASLAFATEATSLHASDDIVSEIQMDISSADIQSWAETSDAYLDYENVVPVYTTMNVSADSNSLVDTLSFKNEYSIPVVTESGDCLGAFTVVNSNGVWMIGAYTMGLDFATAVKQFDAANSYFIEIPQLSGDFGFLISEGGHETYTSIASQASAVANISAEDILTQIKDTLTSEHYNTEGTGIEQSHSLVYIGICVVIFLGAVICTYYVMKSSKRKG